jgi:hypothetical protein
MPSHQCKTYSHHCHHQTIEHNRGHVPGVVANHGSRKWNEGSPEQQRCVPPEDSVVILPELGEKSVMVYPDHRHIEKTDDPADKFGKQFQ